MKSLTLFIVLFLLTAAGCASLSKEQIAALDFGEPPTFYVSEIRTYLNERLDDFQAHLQIDAPEKYWDQRGAKIFTGYSVRVQVSGTRRSQEWEFIFNGNNIVEIIIQDAESINDQLYRNNQLEV